MKFRRVVQDIEAIQYLGDNASKIDKWMQERGGEPLHIGSWRQPFVITTDHGVAHVRPKDWVICGIKREFYPCAPDVFEENYEKIED